MLTRFKKMIPLLALGVGIIGVTASSVLVTSYQSIAKLGPYFTTTVGYDTATGGMPGGLVHFYKVGTGTAETLFVGDVVYLSANNTVLKSATLANYNTVMGVVVGGTKTNMRAVTTTPGVTDTAAYVNQTAIVLSCGRTWVRFDAAAGTPPGTLIQPSVTVSGKATAKAAPIDSLYRVIGRLVDTGIVTTQVLANIAVKGC